MSNDIYLKTGKLFFGAAVFGIGAVHIVTGNFPTGLMPVIASLPARTFFACFTGALLIVAGSLMITNKFAHVGAYLSALIFLLSLVLVDLIKMIEQVKSPDSWTVFFEIFSLFSGSLIMAGIASKHHAKSNGYGVRLTGCYFFAIALLVFGTQHYLYAQFITTLIPAWIPGRDIWPYFIFVAFIAAGISIIIQKQVRLSQALLGLMFFIWLCIVHLPRVVVKLKVEPEWTSLFVALAMSGVAFLIAGSVVSIYKQKR